MKLRSLLFLFLPLSCFATSTVVESDLASYDGKKMQLEGNVILKTTLGSINSEKALLERGAKSNEKDDFQSLHLEDNVCLTFSEGSSLKCRSFDLDAITGVGVLRADSKTNWVTYETNFSGKDFTLKSPEMHLRFVMDDVKQSAFDRIEEIETTSPTLAHFDDSFELFSHFAKYRKETENLSFFPKGNEDCLVVYKKTNKILASRIDFNPTTHLVAFDHPKGTLSDGVTFSSKSLTWEDQKKLIKLIDDVQLKDSNTTLHNNHEVKLYLSKDQNQKSSIQKIESVGETKILYNTGVDLTSYGTASVDHEKKEIILECAPNGKQVIYHDATGTLQANKMLINYAIVNGKIEPNQFSFFGNVSAINTASFDANDTNPTLRYAMADEVYYFPHKKELTLKASKGKKVLFFDTIKKMQLSADELIATKQDKKEHIRSKGRVRMVFNEKELKELKEHFPIGETL